MDVAARNPRLYEHPKVLGLFRALHLLRNAGVRFDVERGPNAADQAAGLTGRSFHALYLPQMFHGKKHVGGVGPLKK